MPRILFVTRYHFLRFTGGAELQCWMLATEFARRGWEVHYVSENSKPGMPELLDGVTLHYLPENPPWHDSNRKGVLNVMKSVRPDVVYNRVFNLYTWHAMSLAPKDAVTIWAAAGQHDGEVTTTIAELWQTKSLMQFCALVPRVIWIRRHARKGALSAKLHLAQSREQLVRLSRLGFHPVMVRNSLDDTQVNLTQAHEAKPLVLWAGSIKQWKRPELFYELAARCSDLECRFVMAGELQDAYSREPLDRARRKLNNFSYLGFVQPGQIGLNFSQAHLFVSTSVAEGFPNTFVQAWQYGVPVVSLDVDPDGLLSRERLGAVVSSMDELEAKVRELLAKPQLRREIGARAREFTLKEFNLHKNVDRLEELIRDRQSR